MDRSPLVRRRLLMTLGVAAFIIVLVGSVGITLWGRMVAPQEVASPLMPLPTPDEPQQGTPIEPPRLMADWTLTSHTGDPLKLSDLRGKVVLLFFGYTFCPDVCPTTLADYAQVKKKLGASAEQLAVVFVSVDGERDTPERLARYVGSFDPTFIGVTGDEADVREMGKEYGLFFQRQEIKGTSAAYLVDHSSASYLIDTQGRERFIYGFNTSPDTIAQDIKAILADE